LVYSEIGFWKTRTEKQKEKEKTTEIRSSFGAIESRKAGGEKDLAEGALNSPCLPQNALLAQDSGRSIQR